MTTMRSSTRHLEASLFTAVLLGLAGCGDGAGGDASSSNSATGPTTSGITTVTTDETSGSMSMGDGDGAPGDGAPGDGDGDPTTTSGGLKFDLSGFGDFNEGDCGPTGTNDATLTGIVYAPNGTIPVSGALVYTTNSVPEPIPDGVYCAECVSLPCGIDYTETDVDGTFSLATNSGGKYLVVQKGQFLRYTQINIAPGNTQIPADTVELPGEWNPPEGKFIPRIAIADGSYDRIEDALGKFGLADTTIANFTETSIPGTESFELYDNGRNPATDGFVSQGTMTQLVSSPNLLNKYHIIFVPCSTDTHVTALNNQQNVDNVRNWVAAGGRWYVADWANEWMSGTFPEYQNFYDDGFGADLGVYDSLADVLDPGMLAWLQALPNPLKDINPLNDEQHPTLNQLPKLMTVDNWSGVQYPLPEIWVDDGMGNPVNVGHRAWLEGPGDGFDIPVQPDHPLTITGQYGCGKIQFTSYHTAEFFDYVGLSPQELVLIYTILEIGVCQDPLPPPQG
jgi:hypothetical protein